jgi:hypothetical protein
MSSETRIERIILRESLPDFFRELAHMFENGGGNGMESIAEFRKMKISIEESSGRIAVQINFKGAEPVAEHHPEVKQRKRPPGNPWHIEVDRRAALEESLEVSVEQAASPLEAPDADQHHQKKSAGK